MLHGTGNSLDRSTIASETVNHLLGTRTRVWSWLRFRQAFQLTPSRSTQENSTRLKHARKTVLQNKGTHRSRWFKSESPQSTTLRAAPLASRFEATARRGVVGRPG